MSSTARTSRLRASGQVTHGGHPRALGRHLCGRGDPKTGLPQPFDPGQNVEQAIGIHCSQGWAVAQIDIGEANDGGSNAYTGVFKQSGSGWVALDPATACPSGQVPANLNQLACNSN